MKTRLRSSAGGVKPIRMLLVALVVASLGATTAWAEDAPPPTTTSGFCQYENYGQPLSDEQYRQTVAHFSIAVQVAKRYVMAPTKQNQAQLVRYFGSNSALRALFIQTVRAATLKQGKVTRWRLTWSPARRDQACLLPRDFPRAGGASTIYVLWSFEIRSSNGFDYPIVRPAPPGRQVFLRGERVIWG